MKIAVLGGGISALVAVYYINKVLGESVDMFAHNIGGEYIKGGLKYIHHSPYSEMLVRDLGIRHKVKKIVGAVYFCRHIYLHPEIFWHAPKDLGEKIQKMHWDKTRGTSGFDKTCMNNPWSYNENLMIVPVFGLMDVLNELVKNAEDSRNTSYTGKIGEKDFMEISKKYDFVISTIPDPRIMSESSVLLSVYKFIVDGGEKIWWDYLYTPEPEFPFHRISCSGDFVSFEINGVGWVCANAIEWFESEFKCKVISDDGLVKIKGHIHQCVDQKELEVKNVFLLGRHAQRDPRMTLDKVVQKIWYKLNDIKENGIGI